MIFVDFDHGTSTSMLVWPTWLSVNFGLVPFERVGVSAVYDSPWLVCADFCLPVYDS